MNGQSDHPDRDEHNIGLLLRGVGKRDLPSEEIMAQVREAVHGEWQQVVDQRRRRTRFYGYATAAGVAAAVLAIAVSLPPAIPCAPMSARA